MTSANFIGPTSRIVSRKMRKMLSFYEKSNFFVGSHAVIKIQYAPFDLLIQYLQLQFSYSLCYVQIFT